MTGDRPGRDPGGPAFQTCVNAGNIAKKFETSRRREVLSAPSLALVAFAPPYLILRQSASLAWTELAPRVAFATDVPPEVHRDLRC
jgi:hypothetical protein